MAEIGGDFRFTSREVHAINIKTQMAAYEEEIRTADVIFSQPVNANYRDEPRLSTNWIKENRKGGSKLFIFVPLYFSAYFPQLGYLPSQESLRMPYFDFNICILYAAGYTPAQAAEIITSEDFYDKGFIEAEVSRAIEELRRREEVAGADIKVSALIESNYRSRLLFFTLNHPARALAVLVANEICKLLNMDQRIADFGAEYLDDIVVSPYPSAAKAIDFETHVDTNIVRGGRKNFTRTDYVQQVFSYYDEKIGKSEMGRLVLENRDSGAYFGRYAKWPAHNHSLLSSLLESNAFSR